MKENFYMEYFMVLGTLSGRMVESMMENLKMVTDMEEGNIYMQMGTFMREILK